MAFRRFRKRFEFQGQQGKVTYPAGWAGEVSGEIAAAADAAQATLLDTRSGTTVVASSDAHAPLSDADLIAEVQRRGLSVPTKSFDDMTRDELVSEAERRGVQVKSSDNKPEIIAALKAAQQPAG